jgi:tetratricopeptide (TPR) repeat protein
MGGYAAMRFAGAVGATRVFAISPQVSINPLRAPFETRWAEAKTISFISDDVLADIPPNAEVFTLYDPYNPDALQMDLLRQARQVTELRAPFAGHGAATLLRDGGHIKPVTMELLTGRFKIDAWPSIRRECRNLAPLYWMNLSLMFLDRKSSLAAVQSARRAYTLAPENLAIQSVLGTALRRSGQHADAVVIYKQMIMTDPTQESRVARALADSLSRI